VARRKKNRGSLAVDRVANKRCLNAKAMSDEPNCDFDRHEIDCICGNTSVAESRKGAEVSHLHHFLNDHDDLEDWEREAAKKQLQNITED